jgi:NAD(P)H dehydrogenase (quinone)
MKIAIIFHSESGNTEKVAGLIAEGARQCEGIEVKTMRIDEVDESFVAEAKAVFLGTPSYGGTYSWQMKKWLDTGKVKLADKIGSAFATANFVGGGADVAELALIHQMLVKGMLVYSSGGAKGAPIIHYGAVTIKDGDDFQQERARIFGKRVAEKALELFGKE